MTQMGALESARMRLHQRNIAGETDEALAMALEEWALIASCVTPFISREDYLQMPVTETRPLLLAVEELNSDMVDNGTPEQAKKKRQK